jgi:hypothetical protein
MLLTKDSSHLKKRKKEKKHWLRVKGVEKSFPSKWAPYKQPRVAILISDKVDFRLKSIRGDNEGDFILMKGTIHQEEISVLSIYASNPGHPSTLKKL